MAKKSELQQAIDRIQGEIDERMRALDVLLTTQRAIVKRKPKRVRTPKPEQAA